MSGGWQDVFKTLGMYGCYFLCLIDARNRTADEIIDAFETSMSRGWIKDDCFVVDPVSVANLFGNFRNVHKSDKLEKCKLLVAYDGVHFVTVDEQGRTVYNPLQSYVPKQFIGYRVLN